MDHVGGLHLVFAGGEIPFIGGASEAPMILQDAQRTINWYLEVGGKNAKEPIALLGCPGLNQIFAPSINPGPVRGAWVLPGGTQCIFVVGLSVYLFTVSVPATANSIAQFTNTIVGTLLTNTGPVCIRDNGALFNGAGGYVVLVDGPNGYYYRMSGAGSITFTGTPTNGSAVLALSGTVNPYIVAGSPIAGTGIPGGATVQSIDFNANTITMSVPATASPGAETITVTALSFGRITDPAFLGADRVAFIEGWLIFNQPGTRTFYTNAPVPYTLAFAGAFYALKDSSSDNLATLFENNREAWLIGERTSEVWYNSGGVNFAFTRLPGIGPQIGCAAKHSITRAGRDLLWLAKNEQGENIVVMTQQYSWERISTHAIEHAIASYPVVSDAVGYSYQEEGHLFYVLSFPTADTTWVIDLTTSEKMGEPQWHQRLSFDPNLGVYHRHKSNCYVDFADLRLVGDYQTGQIYQMSRQFFTDAGAPIRCQRRTPHIWSKENRKRVFMSQLQVEFTPGVGLSIGQGVNPQAMLRWSNDGGFTWSNEHWATIGQIGQTRNRAIWRRLGYARDRVFELNYSDPTARDIIGATLFGEAEDDQEAA
jgi:hypothetical protein